MNPIDWMHSNGKLILPAERVWLRNAAFTIAWRFGEHPVIVNIGVYKCASMYCLRVGAPGARLIGIDINPPEAPIHPRLRGEFFVADSRECHQGFKGPIHLLFHDGDHRYPTVSADIKNWVSKVISGGIAVFHDYNPSRHNRRKRPWLLDVEKAVEEWFARGGWERLEAPESLGAFRRL